MREKCCAQNLRKTFNSRTDCSCSTLAHVVQSPLQWKQPQHHADGAAHFTRCCTTVRYCFSSHQCWAVARSEQARHSLPPLLQRSQWELRHRRRLFCWEGSKLLLRPSIIPRIPPSCGA